MTPMTPMTCYLPAVSMRHMGGFFPIFLLGENLVVDTTFTSILPEFLVGERRVNKQLRTANRFLLQLQAFCFKVTHSPLLVS